MNRSIEHGDHARIQKGPGGHGGQGRGCSIRRAASGEKVRARLRAQVRM